MSRKIRDLTFPNGETHKVEELDFEVVSEPWTEYKLSDGTSLKMKIVALKAFRVLYPDGKPAYNAEGDPFVIMRHNVQISASE
ncbi:MAG: hypothetical protein PHS96_07790 [Anaerolineales bacterium]|nr:hypothetical protein [Anaerolineales bacterium]